MTEKQYNQKQACSLSGFMKRHLLANGGTQTFIADLTQDVLVAPWVINGAMNGVAFDGCVETQLARATDPGTVVILDNLCTHKSPCAAEVLQKQGCSFSFLPAYRPDLDPIELAFSQLKAHHSQLYEGQFLLLYFVRANCS